MREPSLTAAIPSTPRCLGAPSYRKPSQIALILWGFAGSCCEDDLRQIVRTPERLPRPSYERERWSERTTGVAPKGKEPAELDRKSGMHGSEFWLRLSLAL